MKSFSLAMMLALPLPMLAQETYQDTKLIDNDLNGTARYVGMGGAMEALGADISTISTNPAGLGLFRSSQITISGGLVAQQGADTKLSYNGTDININGHKTNMSFDQIGLVWSNRSGRNSFLNVGFNYHKSRNFDQILTAANSLSNASQNKATALKHVYINKNLTATEGSYIWSPVDESYGTVLPYDKTSKAYSYYNASMFLFGQYQRGYIGEYDFNISGNLNDRVYLGLTFGLHDVHYKSNSYYTENLTTGGYAGSWETLKITGTGFDVKAGVIVRPFADSPFRIGAYIHTPTFYDLDMVGTNDVTLAAAAGGSDSNASNGTSYSYKVYTPWKFGVSLGHTVGNYLALGATYEYADYGAIDNRVNDGAYYDGWSYYETSSSDKVMNAHTKSSLKGVSTLKLGVELKAMPDLAIRVGYNYLSSMFKNKAMRNSTIVSASSAVATSTDYTNWKSTNRLTCGVGYTVKKFTIDLAYQYSSQNGEFYPFMTYYENATGTSSNDNVPDATEVSFKRHQLLLTLGYRF